MKFYSDPPTIAIIHTFPFDRRWGGGNFKLDNFGGAADKAKKVSVLCDMLAAETVVSAVQLAALILLRLSLCEYLYPLHVVLKQPFTHFSIV